MKYFLATLLQLATHFYSSRAFSTLLTPKKDKRNILTSLKPGKKNIRTQNRSSLSVHQWYKNMLNERSVWAQGMWLYPLAWIAASLSCFDPTVCVCVRLNHLRGAAGVMSYVDRWASVQQYARLRGVCKKKKRQLQHTCSCFSFSLQYCIISGWFANTTSVLVMCIDAEVFALRCV